MHKTNDTISITRKSLESDMKKLSSPERASHSMRFFKTGKGEYAEGDEFWGLTVPEVRGLAQKYWRFFDLEDRDEKEALTPLLQSPVHEQRQLGLFILEKILKNNAAREEEIAEYYLAHLDAVNNWDLVDGSAPLILGQYLSTRPRDILYKLVKSKNLWHKRIAILTTMYFIYQHDYQDTLALAEILLHHPHDLIHKAVGWLLREVGKKDYTVEIKFLDKYAAEMPRTMLRYSIEKFPSELRLHYLNLTKK